MLKKITGQAPCINTGLLILRVWVSVSLFVKHGWEKIFTFSEMRQHFPDPVHIGATTGLVFAMISDAVCSILIIIGLFTRIAALFEVINLLVIFLFMHQFSFMQEHAEIVYLYLGGYLSVLFCGAGKYSLDSNIHNSVLQRKNAA